MTMPYLLPRRGGLFTDPPSPGGEGAGSTVPSIKDPASPPAWKGCPLDPRSGAPGQAVERTGESPKVTISSPNPRGGGGLSTGHTGRGGMLYTIPPQTPRPPDGPEGLPLRPPRFDPRPSRRANWPIPKGTISLPPSQGPRQRPPLPEGPGSLVPTIRSPGVRSTGTVRPPRRKVRPS
ncbi:hypothetical protein N7530_012887 [Penicillium desertorum]|uniref:Uncharacterized protein n=1 Tax=Penicillium desertorum TaxID=1303715 RepID=A0A9X0BFH0_9EURO|nr:hypothetical protein N7530_012887 [Penicillium desertorum]